MLKINKVHSKNIKILSISLLLLSILVNLIPVFAGDETPEMKIAAMSDLHVDEILNQGSSPNRDQFKAALNVASNKGYSDLFICGGDISTFGNTDEWSNAENYISTAGFNDIVWALGNHEYGLTYDNTDANEDFTGFTSYDEIYHHENKGGYDFICFGCERTDFLISDMVYSTAQENWIMDEIEKTAQEANGKPIFVLSHYPISRTRIENSIIKYNNIIFLYGHVHDADWENYSIDQYVNINSNYLTAKFGSVTYGRSNAADVLLIDVYKDKVKFTLERTEGKTMVDNSRTFQLMLPSWKVLERGEELYWYLPKKENILLCICNYSETGQFLGTQIIEISSKMSEQFISKNYINQNVYSRLFFIDSAYIPQGETTEF